MNVTKLYALRTLFQSENRMGVQLPAMRALLNEAIREHLVETQKQTELLQTINGELQEYGARLRDLESQRFSFH